MTTSLRLALTTLLAALAMTGSAQAAGWQNHDLQNDRYRWDASTIDRDGNGCTESIWFDLDDDGRWDTNVYNSRGGDCFLETTDYDMNENDEVEAELLDGDGREGFDYVRFDRDENGRWDTRRGYSKFIIPGSQIDVITTANTRNATSRMLYDFRRTTGMSLLYPSFPMAY